MSRPATRFSRVDLPQPDGPMIATNSPAAMSRSTPRSARTGARSASNVLRTARTVQTSDIVLPFHSRPQTIRVHGCLATFDHVLAHRLDVERARDRVDRRTAQHRGAGRAGEVLQSLREVHGVADERVLDALVESEQRRRDLTRRQSDAEPEL